MRFPIYGKIKNVPNHQPDNCQWPDFGCELVNPRRLTGASPHVFIQCEKGPHRTSVKNMPSIPGGHVTKAISIHKPCPNIPNSNNHMKKLTAMYPAEPCCCESGSVRIGFAMASMAWVGPRGKITRSCDPGTNSRRWQRNNEKIGHALRHWKQDLEGGWVFLLQQTPLRISIPPFAHQGASIPHLKTFDFRNSRGMVRMGERSQPFKVTELPICIHLPPSSDDLCCDQATSELFSLGRDACHGSFWNHRVPADPGTSPKKIRVKDLPFQNDHFCTKWLQQPLDLKVSHVQTDPRVP